jgi:L-rhamnose isomerase / sugar isomerase
MKDKQINIGIELLNMEFGSERVQKAIDMVSHFQVEIPSWVFGNFGGGRFGEFTPPGCARNIYEKLDDAAFVNKLTGASKQIATHVLWDFTNNGFNGNLGLAEKIAHQAIDRGLLIGSISPTYFLKGSFRGSLSALEKVTTQYYIEQTILAGEIAKKYGVGLVTLWLPDGSNFPGQVELGKTVKALRNSLVEISNSISKDVKILIEYKVFEPGTYSTLLADWGSAYQMAKQFGKNAGVLVDLGHHFQSANIEQIVARLIEDGMWGGFHFNTRYAADDDHSVEPNPEMARIFYELVVGGVVDSENEEKNWAYMIDQCSGRENRIHAILHSIDSLQLSLAKAAIVDQDQLFKYQKQDEVILANRIFNDALLNADVRPIVAKARLEKKLPVNPIIEYVESGYQAKIESDRK